uniref:Cadherin N-terminal domain-containing protein n=1 Tax=Amazona collaria TaxID=241587 RepID=A0A8B9G657_9PSIT
SARLRSVPRALLWGILVAAWDAAWGQLRYSVPEELPKGSFVGDVEKDLGLELSALRNRGVRVVSEGRAVAASPARS